MEFELQTWYTAVAGLTIVVVFAYLLYIRRNDNYWKEKGVPYQPRMNMISLLWIIYTKPLHKVIMEAYYKYGKVHGRFEGSKPGLTVADPDLLKDILVKDFNLFNYRREFEIKDGILSNMVSVLKGEDWKRVRTILTPAFTSKKMRKMANIINSCSDTVVKTIKEHSDKGVAVDCRKLFEAFTMDVIASSAFATKIDCHQDPNNQFVTHARNSVTKQTLYRLIVFLLIPQKLWKYLPVQPFDVKAMEFFRSVTLQVIEERRSKDLKGNDFLQLMIDSSEEVLEGERKAAEFQTIDYKDEEDHYGRIDTNANISYTTKKLSQDEIVAQCVLFFVVGHETSAATLSFLAYNLAVHPECQERLIKEVDEAFAKNTEMTYEDVRDMKYMDSCLSESLRLFPPLSASERTAEEDYELGNTGITIPKGMSVMFPIYGMHHDSEFYPEPEKFDPERFMGENRNNIHPYAYLPFGAGPRNCLGMRFALMEIKLCLSNILRQYRFRPTAETKTLLDFKLTQTIRSPREVPLLLERRNDVKI